MTWKKRSSATWRRSSWNWAATSASWAGSGGCGWGNEWYRVDLLFFHRRLRSLVIIDLKLGKFTHADAGQMHLYLNYAREHWTHDDENPPVGMIPCSQKDEAVARYALEGLPNKVMAAEYQTTLPDEQRLAAEVVRARQALRKSTGPVAAKSDT